MEVRGGMQLVHTNCRSVAGPHPGFELPAPFQSSRAHQSDRRATPSRCCSRRAAGQASPSTPRPARRARTDPRFPRRALRRAREGGRARAAAAAVSSAAAAAPASGVVRVASARPAPLLEFAQPVIPSSPTQPPSRRWSSACRYAASDPRRVAAKRWLRRACRGEPGSSARAAAAPSSRRRRTQRRRLAGRGRGRGEQLGGGDVTRRRGGRNPAEPGQVDASTHRVQRRRWRRAAMKPPPAPPASAKRRAQIVDQSCSRPTPQRGGIPRAPCCAVRVSKGSLRRFAPSNSMLAPAAGRLSGALRLAPVSNTRGCESKSKSFAKADTDITTGKRRDWSSRATVFVRGGGTGPR